jgi:hypothetical protein
MRIPLFISLSYETNKRNYTFNQFQSVLITQMYHKPKININSFSTKHNTFLLTLGKVQI